jgi:ketopantoate hydroxymethyltransferase
MSKAVKEYSLEVKSGAFPTAAQSVTIDSKVLAEIERAA